MKTGILITARLGSTRLKRKHLLNVQGKPILSYLIERIQTEFNDELKLNKVEIVIATSDETDNREFESFSGDGVSVFYGSLNNIPLRHLQAANRYGFDCLVSVDGDDILCSTDAMRSVYASLLQGSQYVQTKGLPLGMNAMGYSVSFLENALEEMQDIVLETGWTRIFSKDELIQIEFIIRSLVDNMRFTLDYPEDFEFFKGVIENLQKKILTISDQELVNQVFEQNLFLLNQSIADEYWSNFNKQIEKES